MESVFDEKKRLMGNYFATEREVRGSLAVFDCRSKTFDKLRATDSFLRGLTNGGVPLDADRENMKLFVDKSDVHTLVIGPTGSKKTRLVVMPTVEALSAAGESMVISDPKAEIYDCFSERLLVRGYKVQVLDLRDPRRGDAWNPFALPYRLYNEGDIDGAYGLINDIAANIIQTDKSQKDPFWDNSAGQLFYGLALMLFRYCKDRRLPVRDVSIKNLMRLEEVFFHSDTTGPRCRPSQSFLWEYAKEDPYIVSALSGCVFAPNDTRESILSVFRQKMQHFLVQPSLVDMLSEDTLDLPSLRVCPMAVFLILPDEKTSHHNLASLFIKQSYEQVIRDSQLKRGEPGSFIRLNYVLDEFSSLPVIADFPAMITASRSRGIRFLLIAQSRHQLVLRYREEAETIMTNCVNWLFLASREIELLKIVSDLCGETKSESPRKVMSVTDLQRLKKNEGEILVIRDRLKPYLGHLLDAKDVIGGEQRFAQIPTRASSFSEALSFSDLRSKEAGAEGGEIPVNLIENLLRGARTGNATGSDCS